eukprot:scaffold10.g2299.t1
MAPIKLIIDTDPGVDDTLAILAAFNSPEEVEVLGLTSVFGNVPTPMATRNAILLRELAGRPDVPVAEGAHRSLRGVAKERIADFVHGKDGFGNTFPPPAQARGGEPLADCSAAEFIVRMSRKYPGEVVVLTLAALTNVALAMHIDPELPERLRRIVVLGGAFNCSGNVNPAAEANIFGDPDAANVVLSRAANVWMLGLDVTHTCFMGAGQLEGLAGAGRHGAFIHAISQFYLQDAYGMEAIYLHDPTAVAAVVAPQLFKWEEGAVVVVDDGPAKGRTIREQVQKSWVGSNEWQARPKVKVALGVQSQEVTQWILERLTR